MCDRFGEEGGGKSDGTYSKPVMWRALVWYWTKETKPLLSWLEIRHDIVSSEVRDRGCVWSDVFESVYWE